MNVRKKIAIILVSICIVLTGCQKSSAKIVKLDPKNPTSIEVWNYYNGTQKKAFDALVAEFNETVGIEKGIVVESFGQGSISELVEKVMDAVNKKVGASDVPEIFGAYADTAYAVDKMGLLVDLRSYMTKEEIEQYIPEYWEEGEFNKTGELKIFPIAKSTEVFMLNKTDWDKFASATGTSIEDLATIEGVTKTAKKYYEWTDSLTPQPEDGKAFFGRDAFANYMIVGSRQLGTELFSVSDGIVTFQLDKKVLRKLWDNFYIPYINGYFASYGRFRSDDAKTGDIIALVCSTSGATYFPTKVTLNDTESYEIESITLPVPYFEDGEHFAVQQGAGMVVTKTDEKKEYAAVEFLKWFTQAQRNVKFSVTSGYLPVKKEANDIKVFNKVMQEVGTEEISDNLRFSLPVALDVIKNNKLYTNKAFDKGTQARDVLENSMVEKAKEDLQKIETLRLEGMSRQEAVSRFATDINFENWCQSLQDSLDNSIR